MRYSKISQILGLLALAYLAGCTSLLPNLTTGSPHLALGNPSNANANQPNNYLITRPQYAMSYNRDAAIANWVSWQLDKTWLGTSDRQNDFRSDDSLPQGWYKADPRDYTNSGYDRGHLAPSADRTKSPADNSATFLMTNIVPQTPDNNRGPWSELEKYSRSLVDQGKHLQIIAGVQGQKGKIGRGKITVPNQLWKIIVVQDRPGNVTTNTRVIAVSMPNQQGIKDRPWQQFRVSVDDLERATGWDFLNAVNPDIQKVIEARVDRQ
jgi:endonuclease G